MQTILNCQICDKQLYNYEFQSLSPFDFTVTCIKHREFRRVTQVWKMRQMLGYEYEKPIKPRCAICLNKISDDELELTMPDDMWVVCDEHAPYRNDRDIDKTRAELGIYIDKWAELGIYFDKGREPKINILNEQITDENEGKLCI